MSILRAEELEEGIVRHENKKVSRDQSTYGLLTHVVLYTKSNGETLEGQKQKREMMRSLRRVGEQDWRQGMN